MSFVSGARLGLVLRAALVAVLLVGCSGVGVGAAGPGLIHSYEPPTAATTPAHDLAVSPTAGETLTKPLAPPNVAIVGHLVAAKGAEDAYDIAAAGGRHAGFLKNYVGRSPAELDRGISSIERQIAEHEQAIADPTSKIPNFNELDPRQQEALVTRKWPGDIQRQREQLQILERLRQGG